jgi:hypothetical protein
MFLGHYAVGLAAKRVVPEVSLGTLVLAGQLADLIWPTLLLARIEHVEIDPGNTLLTPLAFVHYPYSHSLVGMSLWAVLLGAVVASTMRWRRQSAALRAALIVAGLVVSHWMLDVLVHRPDLPLTFTGTRRIGLGLWNVPMLTVILEGLLTVGALAIYVACTTARDRIGRLGLWGLMVFLAAIYAGNLLGPPPPSVQAIAWVGQALWLTVAWAWCVDHHRAFVR